MQEIFVETVENFNKSRTTYIDSAARIAELEAQIKQLREGAIYGKIRLLQTLAEAIAHELRSPLTSINLESSYAANVIIPELSEKSKAKKYGEIPVSKETIEQIEDGFTNIKQSVDSANGSINAMLDDIKQLQLNPQNTNWLNKYGISL